MCNNFILNASVYSWQMIDEPLLLHLTVKLCNCAIITLNIKGTFGSNIFYMLLKNVYIYAAEIAYIYTFLRTLVSDNLTLITNPRGI